MSLVSDACEQRIPLPLVPGSNPPLLPARMLNEFAYCPRLGYLEWVQGEWEETADTVAGELVHRRVDAGDQQTVPAAAGADEPVCLHARSVRLEDAALGLVAVVDVVEVEGRVATPVDYKKGRMPDIPEGAWEPERVQLCAQGLLLRSAGYECREGVIWYAGSRRRVVIPFTEELVARTVAFIREFRSVAERGGMPPPLVDSPKCPRCSLVGICLPDETHYLLTPAPAEAETPRMLLTPQESSRPLHVLEQGARISKSAERLIVERHREVLAAIPVIEVAQLCLFGNIQITTQALHELLDRGIPVCFFTTSGWFRGLASGLIHKNVELRIEQFAAAASPPQALALACAFVAGKIHNARTLIRRNAEHDNSASLDSLTAAIRQAEQATNLPTLLGIEGQAARLYFQEFATLLKTPFRLDTRNRRPPTDPVNAVLSFLYALLVKELTIATHAVGLDPMLGFLHQPRYGRPALALDLAEEFRPLLADSTALTAFNTQELKPEHFITRAGACNLTPPGKRALIAAWERRLHTQVTHPLFGYTLSYRRILAVQARLLARVLQREIPTYPTFRTR